MVPVFPFEVNFTEFICETGHRSPWTKLQPLFVNIFFQSIRKDMYGSSLQSRHLELLPVETVLDAYGTYNNTVVRAVLTLHMRLVNHSLHYSLTASLKAIFLMDGPL